MTDDLYPMTTLPTALRTMAESDQPPVMDVEHVLHRGRHSLVRRRMAAISGGTAAVAATALAVGVLAPAGSAGHRGGASAEPGSSTTTTPAATVTSLPPDVNPHDPVVAHYQFGYLPAGMAAYGGGGGQPAGFLGSGSGTTEAYDPSGFWLSLSDQAPVADAPGHPTQHVPARVPGAVTAFWIGDGSGHVVSKDHRAVLYWQLPGGQWLTLQAAKVEARADWQEQTLKAAAKVIKQDRSVPLPIRIAPAPAGFQLMDGNASRLDGNTIGELDYVAGPDVHSSPSVRIVAFRTGKVQLSFVSMPQEVSTCGDANGLTVCVLGDNRAMKAAPLTAIGGATALLHRVTSLGNDPANWTTDVLP